MKKLNTRTAETLIEIVTAMTVFGVISYGIFDFMANQTIHLHALKTISTKYMCCDEVCDDGGFPRCLVFTRRAIHET